MLYKYYLKARAPSPGAQPSGFVGKVDYENRKIVGENNKTSGEVEYFKAWGHVFYKEKLTQKQIDDYELVYGGVHE